MTTPLEGVRVIEMASLISGPYAGMLLADLGADVIKIELPGKGDVFRQWAGDESKLSPPFAAFNRRKRSVTIDVHHEEGVRAYLALTATADVVFENFRPGVLDRMGVGEATVRAANPSVLYCAISGVGRTGPESHLPTFDAIAQAKSGLTSQFTSLEAPEPVGPPLSDQITGMYAAYAILGALHQRQRDGEGQRIDVSMLGAAIAFQTIAVASYLMVDEVPGPTTRATRSQTYAVIGSDGRPFAIHLSTPEKFWIGLTDTICMPELRRDTRFSTKPSRIRNYAQLAEILAGAFSQRPRHEWLIALRLADVPAGPLNTIEEALADEQVRHLDLVQPFGEEDEQVSLVEAPMVYSGSSVVERTRPPQVGQHTNDILKSLGFGPTELADLRERGII